MNYAVSDTKKVLENISGSVRTVALSILSYKGIQGNFNVTKIVNHNFFSEMCVCGIILLFTFYFIRLYYLLVLIH